LGLAIPFAVFRSDRICGSGFWGNFNAVAI